MLLTQQDTGAKPFTCENCGRDFSRLDSLNRHGQTHSKDRSASSSNGLLDIGPDASSTIVAMGGEQTPVTMSFLAAPPIPSTMPIDSVSFYGHSGSDQTSPDLALGDTAMFTLNWPDSEDLLNSILSSDLMSLPTLDALPSQPANHLEPLPVDNLPSNWLLLGSDRGGADGLHAIRHLSHMISTTV